jgi:hypothetical protein
MMRSATHKEIYAPGHFHGRSRHDDRQHDDEHLAGIAPGGTPKPATTHQ